MTHFIHLRAHSEFSLIDGILTVSPLVAQLSMPAIAITDHCNLFGLVKFCQALERAGKKMLVGADLEILSPTRQFVVTALCLNETGYQHLIQLISHAYVEGQRLGRPIVPLELLCQKNAGLLILSGAQFSDVGQDLLLQRPLETLSTWKTHFPNRYYLELQRVGRPDEEAYIQAALRCSVEHHLPVVATNDVRFLRAEDFEAHEARVCIRESALLNDPKRKRRYTKEQYLKSEQEMQALFADIPDALINSVEIARRCTVELPLGKTHLPAFPVPSEETAESYLATLAYAGLAKRISSISEMYRHRLSSELTVINNMGFAGYFLIVADFIGWAKSQGILVGPGRGSGAGSLVAFVLGITDLDPIVHELLFERFLNPERVSMPDFDIDFCMENRDRVIDYVSERYGRESVSQIITFGTMAAKAVLRDVGRVLGHGYGFVDKLAKLIPFEVGMTLDKALVQEPLLAERYEKEEEVKNIIDLAKKLEGIARNAGKHAGGVVIAPGKLTDFCPLYCEPGSSHWVTQFDKDDVETIGLVKFDFLGLRTLTIIDLALKTAQVTIDITRIPLDDARTFELLKACETTAIFQLESRGMKELVKRLQPDCFEDIVALVALFRPGPLQSGMVDDFIDRKQGRATITYLHPLLEPILKPTYGIIVYQEQVMQIAQVLANYTLGGADILRRAMGKKKPEEMAEQRTVFIEGAKKNGIDERTSSIIFDLVEKFAGYGFNKSHSAAYALLSYQTAWLKAHYPAAFMSAVLSSDMDNTDKMVVFIEECKRMKLRILPPSIHHSEYRFTVTDQNEILFGLGAIKGAGLAALSVILEERAKKPFADLFDFCQRVELRKVNKRVLEVLIKSGAFDEWGISRASLFASLEIAIRQAERHSEDQASGQCDLFSIVEEHKLAYLPAAEWSESSRLAYEKETLGFYMSGHPLNRYEKELKQMGMTPLAQLRPTQKKQTVRVAGIIMDMRLLQTKRGDRMAIVTLSDASDTIDIAVFSELFSECREQLLKNQILVVEGEVSIDEYSQKNKMAAQQLLTIAKARERLAVALSIPLSEAALQSGAVEKLQQVLLPHRGGACPVELHIQTSGAAAALSLGPAWRVVPSDELLTQLQELFTTAEMQY